MYKPLKEKSKRPERLFKDTLDNLLEGCQIISFDWKYLYLNDVAAKHGRQPKNKLIGHSMIELYPGIENTEMFTNLKRCMKDRVSHCMENEFIFPDKSKGWFELYFQPVPQGIFILSLDISERKRAENKIRRLYNLLLTIRNINQLLLRVESELELFQEVCNMLVKVEYIKFVWIGIIEKGSFNVKAVTKAIAGNRHDDVDEKHSKYNKCSSIAVIKTKKPSIIEDIETNPDCALCREGALKIGYKSRIALPLIYEKEVIGILNVHAEEKNAFGDKEVRFLTEEILPLE